MFAIIRAGGKQYKVEAGDTVRVEKMTKNLGDTFDLPEVLMIGGDKAFVGSPLVQNAKVVAIVTRQAKAPKVVVFKKKRRQGYRRMQGHRQLFTELFIQSITSPEGVSTKTDKSAMIIDPVKIQARKDAAAQKQKETKRSRSSTLGDSGEETATKVAAPKKKAAKKATKKTATAAGAKKTAKKATSKSTKK